MRGDDRRTDSATENTENTEEQKTLKLWRLA